MKLFGKSRERVQPDLPPTVEVATEGGEGYPRDFAVASLRERRLSLSLRVVSFCLFGALVLNIVQGFMLISLFPLKEVRPFLVQVAEEGSIVAAIRPIQETFEARDLLTEKLVREYVVTRNEILRSDAVMTQRWSAGGYLGTTTDRDEYNRFVARVTDQLDLIRQQNGQRRVEILSVAAVRAGQVYVVDFRATSYGSDDRVIDQTVYTATVEIQFRPLSNMTHEQMMLNPTGFTVVNHTLAEKIQ